MFVATNWLLQHFLINAEAGTPSPGLAGILTGAKVGLFKTPIVPTIDTLLADLDPADYNTYVVQNAVFGTPYKRVEGGWGVSGALLQFQPTDALVPNLIYGLYVVDSAGTKLLGVEVNDAGPVNLGGPSNALLVSAEISVGGPDGGQSTFIS